MVRMIKAKVVPTMASPRRPVPVAMPIVAVSQMLAAVVCHDLMLLAHFEDDAAADEANAGESALNYAACIGAGHAGQQRQ